MSRRVGRRGCGLVLWGEESEHIVSLAYRKAKKKKDFSRKEKGDATKGENRGDGDGRALYGFNRGTGERNRCITCNSEHHFAPNCPSQDARGKGPAPSEPVSKKLARPPYSSIAMGWPASVRGDGFPVKRSNNGNCEQPVAGTMGLGGPVPFHE